MITRKYDDETVIERDTYDADAFRDVLDALPELRKLAATHDKGGALCADIFAACFKLQPKLRDGADSRNKDAATIMREAMETQEYLSLRATTRLDETASALATLQLAPELLKKLPPDESERRTKLRAYLARAGQEVDEQLEALAAFQGSDSNGGRRGISSLRTITELASRTSQSPKLKAIAQLAGRMRQLALSKHETRVVHGPDEIVDVETGAALPRLLPSELVQLRHPTLRRDFLRRFAEKQLLQYRLEGRERLGRGPIVVCIDESASMDGAPEHWSKAVALGLLAIAAKERRDFSIIAFSSAHEMREWTFDKTPELSTLLSCLEFQYSGGTDFYSPLAQALARCEGSKFDRADVIFITDGLCSIGDSWARHWKAKARKRGTRLYSIGIGVGHLGDLQALSDGVAIMPDIYSQEADALELAFGI